MKKDGQSNGIQWHWHADGKTRSWRWVHVGKDGRVRGPWVEREKEAKAGRVTYLSEVAAGKRPAVSSNLTLKEAWTDFHEGAKAGSILDRSGKVYKPSTLRGYERGWKKIEKPLGKKKLADIRRPDIQAVVDKWIRKGDMANSTIQNSLDPLRAIYRRALHRELVAVNPTVGLEVPKASGKRDRIASREEAAALIAALPEGERALWATAFYGGLRRGELQALQWEDVDFSKGEIAVTATMDDVEGPQAPKSTAGLRAVPIIPPLADELQKHQKRTKRSGADLVFGRTAADPFVATTARSRALAAWKKQKPPLAPIKLHECRHTFASMLIAAGCNAKDLSVVMGHSSISTTFDFYAKMMPGGTADVGGKLGAYISGDQ